MPDMIYSQEQWDQWNAYLMKPEKPEIIYDTHIRRNGNLTYQEALAAGYRTVGLGQRLWEREDSKRQEDTGVYRGFRRITRNRNRIEYAVRFPAVHVVKPSEWGMFIVRVQSFKDAEQLARKIGEGTVIQRVVSNYRAWYYKERKRKGKRTAEAFGVRGGGTLYARRHWRKHQKHEKFRYWIMIEGMLVEMPDNKKWRIVGTEFE